MKSVFDKYIQSVNIIATEKKKKKPPTYLFVLKFKDQLIPLWDTCLLSEMERSKFITSLYEKSKYSNPENILFIVAKQNNIDTKLEIKSKVDQHMTYLSSIQVEGQALKALMKERKDLIQVK